MKKFYFVFVLALILIMQSAVSAQELLIQNNNVLPQLNSGLPDPAAVTGSIGSLYQENYQYYDTLYDTYLYPQPESALPFIEAYLTMAGNAGYTGTNETIDGYNALRIAASGNPGVTALLFYDYQGYMLFMVPVSMNFALNSAAAGPEDGPALVSQGYDALQNGDYEAAVRYLIRAAGSYIRSSDSSAAAPSSADISASVVPTATLQPSGPTTYVVQDGDTCWGIAVDRFGVNFELFMQVNGMVDCNIGIGQEVIIPGADQQVATSTPIPLDQYTMGQVVAYTVEMNDSYNDIAAKFNTTLDSIQRMNNVNVYTTFPQYGQVLQIEVNLVTPTPLPEATATPEVATLQP